MVWLELLAQWPPDLLIYRGPPPGTSWRLAGFAYAVQLTMVGIVGDFLWRVPRLFALAVAIVIGVAVWRLLLPERVKARRGALLATAIVALLTAIAITSLAHPTYRSIFEVFPSRRAVGRPGPPVRSDSPGRPPIPHRMGIADHIPITHGQNQVIPQKPNPFRTDPTDKRDYRENCLGDAGRGRTALRRFATPERIRGGRTA